MALLAPPFDGGSENPGYIGGYVPGVRENGGQYTHAAVWAVMAFAELGDAASAWSLLRLINPLCHADSGAHMQVYKVEPYVVAADVYAVAPHVGRGGWTWYTGSAGWFYRLLLESLLGLQRAGAQLAFTPCLPPEWPGFKLAYPFGRATYAIEVVRLPQGAAAGAVVLDGVLQASPWITLQDDGGHHVVQVQLAALPAREETAPMPDLPPPPPPAAGPVARRPAGPAAG
jgi:cellobiose phosphorylase